MDLCFWKEWQKNENEDMNKIHRSAITEKSRKRSEIAHNQLTMNLNVFLKCQIASFLCQTGNLSRLFVN